MWTKKREKGFARLAKTAQQVQPKQVPAEHIDQKQSEQDYETLFIKESNITARLGKTVYVRKEFHERMMKIVHVIGENEISLSSYIDNVLAHHFESFQDDIMKSYKHKNNNNLF